MSIDETWLSSKGQVVIPKWIPRPVGDLPAKLGKGL